MNAVRWALALSIVLGLATASYAGTAYLTGPTVVTVDHNPGTVETLVLEIIVGSSTAQQVSGFEWQLGVTGSGVAFDAVSTESMTRALVTDSAHSPAYFLYGDSFGFDAAPSAKGIRGGDLSSNLSAYDPAGTSLGYVVLTVTDETAALGVHEIQDPESFFLLSDFASMEGLEIPSFQFTVVPEPATLSLLAVGMIALSCRRRRTAR
jgi:hypothetical protein